MAGVYSSKTTGESTMRDLSSQRCGALLVGLGVIAGAFGAHALKVRLDPAMLAVFEKAVFYQLIHGLALLSLSSLALTKRSLEMVTRIIVGGVILFSGSLYVYVLTGVRAWAMVTPVGGSLLILAWFFVFFRVQYQTGDVSEGKESN